jgi:hypothetical protein
MRTPLFCALVLALATSSAFATSSNRLEFAAHPFDPALGTPAAPAPFSLHAPSGAALHVVQFTGPIRQAWLDALTARGLVPVHYVASHGYLVWADDDARARLAELRRSAGWIRYDAPFYGFLKVEPQLAARTLSSADADVDIVVQVYAHDGVAETQRFVESRGVLAPVQQAPLGPGVAQYAWSSILGYRNLALRVRATDIPAIAERPDVTFVGERTPARPMDEKQALILSGDLRPGPASTRYLDFLASRGFSTNPDDYPLIDLTDSTIDEGGTGVTVLDTIDPMLREHGDASGRARVEYFHNCSTLPDDEVGAADGHGSLNAGIIGGYDARTGYPFEDGDGTSLGLGLNPFARLGSTTIFVHAPASFDIGGCEGSDQGIVRANAAHGARISSNSWGYGATGGYTDHDQIYDAAVRDVDVDAAGSQPMIYIVAAANDGPGVGTIASPAAGKNVITVGASENLRPFTSASDLCQDDGADAADDPQSIADFSSRGPVAGARVKPEIVAPGTHIQAGASVFSGYAGGGVCITHYPESPEQTIFAVSSGTSHATPAVSGVASLAYWWIEHGGAGDALGTLDEIGGARAPSPALMKAWLIAHPNYLTGVGANDDLPSNSQGYGMPDMSAMFDATPKLVVDQSERFDESGETRDYTFGAVDPAKPVRIVLAYTDAPGAPGTSPEVNDLDLAVTIGGATYLGNHFSREWSVAGGEPDDRNNYEAVFLPAGTLGDLAITVGATNIAGDGVPNSGDATDQDFALVCTNCTQQPSFTLTTDDASLQVCSGHASSASLRIGSILGFGNGISLALESVPSGASAAFAPNPVTAPGTSTLTVGAEAGLAAGTYATTVRASAGTIAKTLDLALAVFDVAPSAPSNLAPADGATDVSPTPTLTWSAAADAYDYRLEIARDPAFADIVLSRETTDTAYTLSTGESLDTSARYWWRVVAQNPCGATGGGESIFADGFDGGAIVASGPSFTTLALPGDCPVDETPSIVFADDLESGASGWAHGAASGSVDGWSLGAQANSATHAWLAAAPGSGAPNDAWLVSPTISLPADLTTLSLKFWNAQNLKSGDANVCNDGAAVEISTNGGGSWTPLTNTLTDPFDGVVSGAFGNPLAGRGAWCGDPASYTNSVVDVQAYAGASAKFRFHVGHDRFPHRPGTNWAIDDIRVTGCSE